MYFASHTARVKTKYSILSEDLVKAQERFKIVSAKIGAKRKIVTTQKSD